MRILLCSFLLIVLQFQTIMAEETSKIKFSRKKELLAGNVETNLIKSFPSVPEYDAVAARISVDNNIQFSEAGIALRSKDDKPLAELKAISNGGWTYIQYGAAEIHKQYTTNTNKTVLNIRMTIVDSGKTVRMEWRRDGDESWQLIDTLPQNAPVITETIQAFSSKDGIVRDVYAQSLIDGKVLEPYQTGEILTSPVAGGEKSFRLGDPELTAAAIVSVNPSEQFSQGSLYLESADRKKSAWLKAISNAGWTYIQYGFNDQGQGNITTLTKDKAIKLRIAYIPASGKFSMDWGLAPEDAWNKCGLYAPPKPFLPESVRVASANDGRLTSLILNYNEKQLNK